MTHIRFGTDADITGINAVERSAGNLFAGTHMAWAVGETTGAGQLATAARSDNLWVAEAGGAIAGFLLAEQMDGDFYIHELAVARSHQRRGIGRELIETALSEAFDRGYRTATMTTDRTLPWNAPYYQRLGFRILGADETSPKLKACLAGQSSTVHRCAMERAL